LRWLNRQRRELDYSVGGFDLGPIKGEET